MSIEELIQIASEPVVYNEEYCVLLIQNSDFHKKVNKGQSSYASAEYREMQTKLLQFERKLSAKEIIAHAEHCFPQVHQENGKSSMIH